MLVVLGLLGLYKHPVSSLFPSFLSGMQTAYSSGQRIYMKRPTASWPTSPRMLLGPLPQPFRNVLDVRSLRSCLRYQAVYQTSPDVSLCCLTKAKIESIKGLEVASQKRSASWMFAGFANSKLWHPFHVHSLTPDSERKMRVSEETKEETMGPSKCSRHGPSKCSRLNPLPQRFFQVGTFSVCHLVSLKGRPKAF